MPFDPDFDADNPFATQIPERFVWDPTEGPSDEDWGDYLEATYDSDEGPYAGMEDAAFEMALFGDC